MSQSSNIFIYQNEGKENTLIPENMGCIIHQTDHNNSRTPIHAQLHPHHARRRCNLRAIIVFHDRCKNGINDVISLFLLFHITGAISTSTPNPLLAQSEHALQSYCHGKIEMTQNECLIYAQLTPIVSLEPHVADQQIWVRWRALDKRNRVA